MTGRLLGWGAAGAALAVLLAALAWGLAHPAGHPAASLLGRPAPNLTVQSLDGPEVSLAGLRGKPVVLNFWASWCSPCRQEAGVLGQAARSLEGSVAFLGVDFRDSPAAARAFQAQFHAPYPVGPAAGGIPSQYGVSAPPETFFIDSGGLVTATFTGPLSLDALQRYLQLVNVR